jgi:hypothetical protein
MLTLKASVAALVLAGTALASAGAGYVVSRITMTAQVAVTCPAPAATASTAELPHSLPNGPAISATKGREW